MSDLFSLEPSGTYPAHPGYKGLDATSRACSRDAAASIAGDASRLRKFAMATLATLGEGTAEQVSVAGGQFLNPRLSECKARGWVVATGERHKTQAGRTGAILRLTEAGRAVLDE